MPEVGDAALIRRCQIGDQEAFRTLVDRYRHRLYAVAYGVLRNREDALDAVQDTLIKMYRALDGFKSGLEWDIRRHPTQVLDYQGVMALNIPPEPASKLLWAQCQSGRD